MSNMGHVPGASDTKIILNSLNRARSIWTSQRIFLTVTVDGIRRHLESDHPQDEHYRDDYQEQERNEEHPHEQQEAQQEYHDTGRVRIDVVCSDTRKNHGQEHRQPGGPRILADRLGTVPSIVPWNRLGQVVRTVLAEAVTRLHLFSAVWAEHDSQSGSSFL